MLKHYVRKWHTNKRSNLIDKTYDQYFVNTRGKQSVPVILRIRLYNNHEILMSKMKVQPVVPLILSDDLTSHYT